MNINTAIEILRSQGHIVEKIPNRSKTQQRWMLKWKGRYYIDAPKQFHEHTDKELLRVANVYTHKHSDPWNKILKKTSNSKNRQATRNAITHEKFDDIPQDKPVKTDDVWNYN